MFSSDSQHPRKERTMKKVPAYIINKIERANRLALEAEKLNVEVEEWMESYGCECASDALYDIRETHGEVMSVEDFIEVCNQQLS